MKEFVKVKAKKVPDCSVDESWLKPGQEYIVLSVISSSRGIDYRICSGISMTPVIHESTLFDVVSNKLSSYWVMYVSQLGDYLELSPPEWNEVGFWDRFFDNDINAGQVFWDVSYRITAEED